MKIIEKIFRDKKSNTVIYILLAVGILMLIGAGTVKRDDTLYSTKTENSNKSFLNAETESILSQIDGVGEVYVMTNCAEGETVELSGKAPYVQSVLVVADGGANPVVKEKIVRAVRVALGVDAHKIEVFERKEQK